MKQTYQSKLSKKLFHLCHVSAFPELEQNTDLCCLDITSFKNRLIQDFKLRTKFHITDQ